MRVFVPILLTTFSATAFGHNLDFKCIIQDSYLEGSLSKKFSVGKDSISIEDGKIQISISESECEDSTDLILEKASFNDLKKGKSVSAKMQHSTPEVELTSTVACQIVKK